jgi:DNA-binding LacI/PurR family transcriptional regulator
MDDVARAAGVSRALVSLVVRGRPNVSDAARGRVLAAAAELGYRPNALARNLARRRTRTVGVLLNELHNPFYAEIMDGIDEVAARLGYDVLIGTAGRRPRGEEASVEAFLQHRADGLVLVGPRLPARTIDGAAALAPTVVVARAVRSARVDTVVNDEREGALLAVRHLAELGHERIAHVDGGRGANASARRRGYEAAMRKLGLGDRIRVVRGDYTDAAGVAAAERLLGDGELPTAVFTANDLVAVGLRDRLEDAGVHVPRDLSLVGYDNTFLAALHHVGLTTVNQPRALMGTLAMRALVERVEEGRSEPVVHRLAPSLVVRGSTAPPRQARSGSGSMKSRTRAARSS